MYLAVKKVQGEKKYLKHMSKIIHQVLIGFFGITDLKQVKSQS